MRPASTASASNSLIEPTGTGFLDEGEKLIRAHLDALPEVISDDDAPVLGGRVIDEQFRAPAVAIAAQHGNPGKASGIVHFLFLRPVALPKCSHDGSRAVNIV